MKILRFKLVLPAFALALCMSLGAQAAELTVAAAANFKYALDELVTLYQTNYPDTHINVTYGGSGNFYAQLQNQAPFDLFFSADMDYARRLADAGLTLDGKVLPYAIGHLVLWVRNESPLHPESQGMRILIEPAVQKIAIANPELAPYGAAAAAAMETFGVYAKVSTKLVLGESIAQAAQFVQSGAADVGFIATSQALAAPMKDSGRFWKVPEGTYPAVEQGVIILAWTKNAAESQTFRDFVLGEQSAVVLQRYGYALPKHQGTGK